MGQEGANHVIAKQLLRVKKATKLESKFVIVLLKRAYNDANQVSDQNLTVNKATKSHIDKSSLALRAEIQKKYAPSAHIKLEARARLN